MIIQKIALEKGISVCFFAALQITAALFMLTPSMVWAAEKPEPFNRIVIIVDNSGSFTERRMEAIERTTALLDAISSRKLNRWEKSNDEITLISMDAIPEVIWRGSLAELKALAPDFWTARFEARTDYAGCTDVTGAFRVAVGHLEGDPRYVHKYLLVFSDLVHQPPIDSINKPDRANRLPGDDFPWEGLKDVSVSAFWVPPEQKLAWSRAINEHGLLATFAIYTTSESGEVEIQPPPKPTIELTDAERKAERQRYMGYARKLGVGAGIFILAIIVLAAAIAFGLGYSRRRQPNRLPPKA